ncbi:hypothetical protein ACJIZ3_009561 [Penstemon smallii]|uniref:Transmembrane protein n=1 Tax=Penstemon smallii TaxID=265156 RepID=A0ABD3TDP2_9LAMI
MAVSLNSVISFNPTANYQQATRSNIRALLSKLPSITSPREAVRLRHSTQGKRSKLYLLSANGDNVITETTVKDSIDVSSDNVSNVNSSASDEKVQPSQENGKANEPESSAAKSSPTLKRAPLTARERLRAARVLNRYTEPKRSSPALTSKLMEALRETDKGKKRPGLPEAPTNMLDDSKRGLSQGGWNIVLPEGMDVFLIVISFVLISTLMFATTFVVWKVGAIHFNEY